MSTDAQRTALYRFYDSSERLLYVGVTRDPEARFGAHSREKAWWPEVTRKDITWLASRDEAAIAEIEAIRTERPRYNKHDRRAPALLTEHGCKFPDATVTDWVSFAQIARRIVEAGFVTSMTGAGVKHIATHNPEWPVPRDDWRQAGHAWVFPWRPIEAFFRDVYVERKRGRAKR